MIEPNRLSAPGEAAARARVEALYAAADRLGPPDLWLSPVPRRDLEEREVLLAALERVADAHGRGALLDEARTWLRDALEARAVSRWTAETGATGQVIAGRPEDAAAIVLAIEDAVSVAVTEDLLDPGGAATLANPGRQLLGIASLPDGPGGPGEREGARSWEPSADDWAASAAGGAAVEHGVPPPGTRTMRAGFFAVAGVVGVVAALAWGLTDGSLLLGALIAVAVASVCWTFATWQPLARARDPKDE